MYARKQSTVRHNTMHSSNKALIVGTGFGKLYKSIYESIGWEVTTIDTADPEADYTTLPLNESGMANWDMVWDIILKYFLELGLGKIGKEKYCRY